MDILVQDLGIRGEDMTGAMERFLGDTVLYETCFKSFLKDRAFVELKRTIDEQNYKVAFDCTHTLKGVAGNLGLVAMFNVISELGESLRNNEYSNLQQLHQNIVEEQEKLMTLI